MEELIILNPEKYLKEPDLKLISRQYAIGNYRFDLLFEDRHNGKLIVEIQRGTLDRNHTYKILDYYDEYKKRNPVEFIDLMIVANKIPRERRDRLSSYGISFHEIPESFFLDEKSKLSNIPQINSEIDKSSDHHIEFEVINSKDHKTEKLSIKQKVLSIFNKTDSKIYSREDIKYEIIKRYPETNLTSIIPSDYCYNIWNKGIKFDFHLFEYLGNAKYKCLGKDYPYEGDIFWKDEKVGFWKNGQKTIYKNEAKNFLKENKSQKKYNKFGEAALLAATHLELFTPWEAWELAVKEVFPESKSSQIKNCPKNSFLGLCEEGLIKFSKPGNYTSAFENKNYALSAINILKSTNAIIDKNKLWLMVLNGQHKKHNSQMDVVIALWKNGMIK